MEVDHETIGDDGNGRDAGGGAVGRTCGCPVHPRLRGIELRVVGWRGDRLLRHLLGRPVVRRLSLLGGAGRGIRGEPRDLLGLRQRVDPLVPPVALLAVLLLRVWLFLVLVRILGSLLGRLVFLLSAGQGGVRSMVEIPVPGGDLGLLA